LGVGVELGEGGNGSVWVGEGGFGVLDGLSPGEGE